MKTKTLSTVILVCLCSLFLQGQNSALDIIYGKQYFDQTGQNFNSRNKQLGNRIGFNYNIKTGASNWFKIGIHHYELKEKSNVLGPLVTATGQNPITGQLIIDTITSLQYFHTRQSIEIPINFRTEFGGKKLKPFIEGGFSVSLLLDQKVRSITDGIVETQSYQDSYDSKASFILSLSAGLSYNLNKRFAVLFQPFYKLNITDQEALMYRAFIVNYGIQTGLRMLL